jgi:membrane-associated phospholipid phosphatase
MVLFSEGPIRFLQSLSSPWLDAFFSLATDLGDRMILFGLTMLLWWLWDKRIGFFVATTLLVSAAANGLLKEAFGMPRPDPSLWKTGTSGNGFPSGHAQQTTAFASSAALRMGRIGIPLGVAGVALVSVSRVYLGVHFVGDVLGGIGFGVLVLVGIVAASRATFWSTLGFRTRIAIALLTPSGVQAVLLLGFGQVLTALGLLTGLSLGYLLESRFVRMERPSGRAAILIRLLAGGAVLAALEVIRGPVPAAWEYVYLGLVGLIAAAGLPWLFVRLEALGPGRTGAAERA